MSVTSTEVDLGGFMSPSGLTTTRTAALISTTFIGIVVAISYVPFLEPSKAPKLHE